MTESSREEHTYSTIATVSILCGVVLQTTTRLHSVISSKTAAVQCRRQPHKLCSTVENHQNKRRNSSSCVVRQTTTRLQDAISSSSLPSERHNPATTPNTFYIRKRCEFSLTFQVLHQFLKQCTRCTVKNDVYKLHVTR